MARGMIEVDVQRCKGCQLCIAVCPKGILKLSSTINKKGFHPLKVSSPKDCTGCGFCYDICPDVAIEVFRQEKEVEET